MHPVSVRLSLETLKQVDRLAARLGTDRSEALRRFIERGLREARIDHALELLRKGEVSTGYAAKMARISIYEVLDLSTERGIASAYGPEDLERDRCRLRLRR